MTEELKISREAVLELAEILKETNLTEIEYETKLGRIRVVKSVSGSVLQTMPQALPSSSSTNQEKSQENLNDLSNHQGAVKSPMVGTSYLSSEPNSDAFVRIGDSVSVGQTLLIIESMKVMNPIKAQRSGKVVRILAKDSTPVEFNEVLMIIE
ncbi:MAG: acetyl-CoA carboxylase, biotin carboxyl carrier protein [Proteobacteria bacterium]|nr:acetyl-CoA carboxylase, biotin carboxyl carrier protein [Pseudomonadota bacterium]